MPVTSIITFKAGRCDYEPSTEPPKVKPLPEPGYIYLFTEDEILHFCWRSRSAPADDPSLKLIMFPQDCTFKPYRPTSSQSPSNPTNATNGRVYILKFDSSSDRHFFWLQSRSQHQSRDPAWFSARDLKLGETVNSLLQGEEIDVQAAISRLTPDQGPDGDDDEDATMQDADGSGLEHLRRHGSGGAGPGATGGDVTKEGQGAREGGADGGRANPSESTEANAIIQNFLKSMGGPQQGQSTGENLFTTLAELLTPAHTIPLLDSADSSTIEKLFEYLPPNLLQLAQDLSEAHGLPGDDSAMDVDSSLEKRKDALRRVLRSPQFSQSLSSLTIALRDGGLPSISEALSIPVQNGGYMRRGGVPLGGGDAVEAFIRGVRDVSKEQGPAGDKN